MTILSLNLKAYLETTVLNILSSKNIYPNYLDSD